MKGQFSAHNLSTAARRAAHASGMKTIRSYDILNHVSLETAVQRDPATPMLKLYNSRRELTLTAGDLKAAIQNLEPSSEPLARVK